MVVLKTLFSVEIGRIGHVVGVGRGVFDVGSWWSGLDEIEEFTPIRGSLIAFGGIERNINRNRAIYTIKRVFVDNRGNGVLQRNIG